ncbi:hypothetical protein GJAV_G00216630 [Gymnothorax javanicus]|nr:hypothetical protein GJAV_G00216630 [Gymnothorax javanicus]
MGIRLLRRVSLAATYGSIGAGDDVFIAAAYCAPASNNTANMPLARSLSVTSLSGLEEWDEEFDLEDAVLLRLPGRWRIKWGGSTP